jgi:hypothetical protein
LQALTAFAWTISELHRIELYIEPWNTGSIRVAESAGYRDDGLLRSHQQSVMPGGACCFTQPRGLDAGVISVVILRIIAVKGAKVRCALL